MDERRKNPARKRGGDLGVIYLVDLDTATERWNITRDGAPTGAFARDKATAIGVAFDQASLEAKGSNQKVTVYSVVDGVRTMEWGSP